MLSPGIVGTDDTRISTSRLATRILMRPSWGKRRSAMLRSAITLTREIIVRPVWCLK